MPISSFAPFRKSLLAVAVLLLAFGCSLHKANKAYDEGRFDDAVVEYRAALRSDPTNTKARIGIKRASQRACEAHLTLARQADMRGFSDTVLSEVKRALILDPDNQIAQDWLIRLEEKAARDKAEADASEDLELMKVKADAINAIQLNPRSVDGLDLNFSRKTSLKEIFATLSKASGVNIIAHASYQDQSISIDLRGLPFQRILDTLMLQNDLFYKVIDKNTIMVFKDTQQNKDKYENQIIKTYYLSYADPAELRSTLTTLNPQLRVFTDKRTNALIVKAKPVELAIADQVIRTLDKGKAEVMVYFELMEVTENTLESVGLLPVLNASDSAGTYRLGATTVNNTSGMNTNSGFTKIHTADIRVLFPNLALDFLKSNGDARLVASPNVRVSSGETGEVNIGEKISTTQSQLSLPTTGTTGAASASSLLGGVGQTSFSYEDVGVKIKVEPRVHNNGEITLKIDSTVTTLKSGSTPGRPDLGKREIKTSARLRDGETAIFGGLLKDEEQKSLQGIWGLADIPLIGRLIGNTHNSKAKTDVILTIRAVLVRKPVLSEQDMAPFNPDDAASKAGPFTPPEAKKPATAKPTAPAMPATSNPATVTPTAPAPAAPVPPATSPIPQVPPQGTPPPAALPTDPAPPSTAIQEKKPNDPPPAPSDLVIFMSPVASEIKAGERVRINLTVSGGGGLTSGSMELRIPPGLRLQSVTPGDFLMGEGGGLEQFPGKDGVLKLTFRRNPGGSDSGPFATLELEGLSGGNAPVLIQSGQFLVGTAPISGRWSNALVTVQ
ncbi:secretin N-terminal domain-containing protein [Geothrix sp. PMB-07]|uniref:secretin N-terminal domain-containing protein n=1 Tax=Geothrix sp. PMB-07 TaxID=3068640 RepID=UPI0027418316|nr:secretin N-terminal domain-containing protein [Geothrix sp. PMB-07]WLT33002.1 secretin N-terminal domain-containing protein [Geothrix sp. PMB-07]